MSTQREHQAANGRRPAPGLSFEVAAAPASVRGVRRALSAFAGAHGADVQTRNDVALAVSEAVTNAVLHAYGTGREGAPVHVRAVVHDDVLDVLVADEGLGTTRRESPARGLGLGLGVIADTTVRSQMRSRRPHGTEMWMRFGLRAHRSASARAEHPVAA
jgi:anti-sigma regulatory factor (Ser/Thr protein kinase)